MEHTIASRQYSEPCTVEDVRVLYARHGAELRLTLARLAGRLVDPDDLLHEVFLVAMRNCTQLGRATSRRAWLFGVATKVAATQRRSATLRSFFGLGLVENHPSPESPQRSLEQRQAGERVQQGLSKLSEAKRSVFVLYELQGLKGEEIAEALAIPLKTVWTRLFHARREFEQALARLEAMELRRAGLDEEKTR
ncbi:MAG: RNA polymerase sigma factor [Archangiaceae bacterium]|nr:RNA polymerase sigma factor [Archangiaceae bacterium]